MTGAGAGEARRRYANKGSHDGPCLVFSTLIGRGPTMFCSDWSDLDYNVAPPALLCNKEPAPKAPSQGL